MARYNYNKFALKILFDLFDIFLDSYKPKEITYKRNHEIFLLILRKGKTFAEVADFYHIPENNARKCFYNELNKLKVYIANSADIFKYNDELVKMNELLYDSFKNIESYLEAYNKYITGNNYKINLQRDYMMLSNIPDNILYINLKDTDLSLRLISLLTDLNIITIKDLLNYDKDDLLNFRGLGISSFVNIKYMLDSYNLKLGMLKDDSKYNINVID